MNTLSPRCLTLLVTTLALAGLPARAEKPAASELPPLAGPVAKKKYTQHPYENELGYSKAVRVGNTLYISGAVGSGPMPEAIKKAYGSIEHTLRVHGLGFQHVVKENVYTTDIDALKASKDVRKTYYGTDFPAATWVQVARLFNPEHVIEVEVIAAFPE